MTAGVPDVHQTLEFRLDATIARFLPDGLALCLLGLAVPTLFDRVPGEVVLLSCIVVAGGIALIGSALWRRSNRGKPLYVLSPMGIHYRLASMILIPWREIRGVDRIDLTTFNWSIRNPGKITFDDVTAVLVSKEFYDAHIHVDSIFRRGPGWQIKFIEKGPLVQVAVHHEVVSVTPKAMRDAVTARWHAFRDQPVSTAPDAAPARRGTSVPVVLGALKRRPGRGDAAAHPAPPPGIAAGGDPRAMSPWRAAIIVVLLIGNAVALTNLLGLWATSGQLAAREELRKSAEENKRRKEEWKRREEEQKKTRERFEQMFRRM